MFLLRVFIIVIVKFLVVAKLTFFKEIEVGILFFIVMVMMVLVVILISLLSVLGSIKGCDVVKSVVLLKVDLLGFFRLILLLFRVFVASKISKVMLACMVLILVLLILVVTLVFCAMIICLFVGSPNFKGCMVEMVAVFLKVLFVGL